MLFEMLKETFSTHVEIVGSLKLFEVQCDAYGDCLGAVLLQEGHAIAYESRRLNVNKCL